MQFINELWTIALSLFDLFVHLDTHLTKLVQDFGPWVYVIAFVVIFCETGLVVTPILPGDSFLFALGALSALDGSPLNVYILGLILFIAAVLGDACNYSIGRTLGPKVFKRQDSWLLNQKHLQHTHAFYERHGGKTIILARFIPIVRTFAPFVAGVGQMSYRHFGLFNIIGAALWVPPFLFAGYYMGNLPQVKTNFHYIVVAIVIVSVLPGVVEFIRSRKKK